MGKPRQRMSVTTIVIIGLFAIVVLQLISSAPNIQQFVLGIVKLILDHWVISLIVGIVAFNFKTILNFILALFDKDRI